MALSRDAYRELEDIVGPENISEDLVVLDAYSFFQYGGGVAGQPKDHFLPRPEVVVLPGGTEDVQKIIKLCNRRGLKAKASSTGYGPMNSISGEGSILLDMRRMNRILELDEKNMYVVVEPYVSFVQVQAEAMKRGLNTHIIGAGCQVSYLASHTSMVGNNTQAVSHGYSARNLLGSEWVLPSGEILRLGSLGSGTGWFSGDGPGPSLRGIMRGAAGASGGLGVFTKCAGHLHPWPGPAEMEIKGTSPYYEMEIPPNFAYHVVEWPTWEQCADAQYKIGGAGIAFAFHKTGGPGSHGSVVTGSNNEYYEKWAELKQIPEVSWAIVLAGHSPAEHEYQVKTLDKILADTGGKITPLGEKRIWKNRDYINMVRACFIPRLAFRLTGTFTTDGMMGQETIDNCALSLKLDGRLRDKYAEKKGAIMNDDTYNNWGVTYEGAHWGLLEGGYQFDPLDEESVQGMSEMMAEGSETALKLPVGGQAWISIGASGEEIGALCYNFPDWKRKIKKAFDPNTVSDPSGYVSLETA